MHASNIDNESDHLSDTQEGDVPGLGNAAVHELNQIRAEALRKIDEGGFSCAASLSHFSFHVCSPSRCFKASFNLNGAFVAGTGFY